MSGAEPIAYRDFSDWSRLTKIELEFWEAAAVMRLDSAYLESRRQSSNGSG